MADIGENIKNARAAAGITQRELADDLYVVQQSVYKWENGMSYPQSDKLEDIARALGVSVLELFAAGSVADLFPAADKQGTESISIEEQINSGYVVINYTDEYIRSIDNLRNKCKNGNDPVRTSVLSAALKDLYESGMAKTMRLWLSDLDKEIVKIGLRKSKDDDQKSKDILLGFWRFRYPVHYNLYVNLGILITQEKNLRKQFSLKP